MRHARPSVVATGHVRPSATSVRAMRVDVADPGVSARGVRRRRRARRLPRPRAARAASTSRCTAFGAPARRGAARRRTPARRARRRQRRRCRPSASTWRWPTAVARRRPRALAHLVRQPRRPPRHAAVRHPARRHRALARAAAAVEGRAARRRLPVSSWAERTAYEAADAVIAVSDGMRDDVLRRYPALDPARVHVDLQRHRHRLLPPRPRTPTCCDELGVDPDRPYVVVRRPDHPAEGRCRTCCAPRAQLRPERAARAAAPAPPDTPELKAETDGARRRACASRATASCWIERDAAARRASRQVLTARDRRSSARRSTSRSASSTSRRWPARPPSSPAPSAASPRSSSTARPACSCRSTRPPTAPARRSIRAVRRRLRRRAQRGRRRPRPRRRDGPRRPPARDRRLQLGRHRRPHRRGLPLGALTRGHGSASVWTRLRRTDTR